VILCFLLTLNPAGGQCQPKKIASVTAYSLKGHTASGPTTGQVHKQGGCIALSRPLAKDLGLYLGRGRYDFGALIEVTGHGVFIFADLMPPKWKNYMVDIFIPSYREALAFGRKRYEVRRLGLHVDLEDAGDE